MIGSVTYSKAQTVKLCENDNCTKPCQFFCTICDIQLCYKCPVEHILMPNMEGHNIVRYRYKGKGKLIKPFCALHGKLCFDFCSVCKIPCCYTCQRSFTHKSKIADVSIALELYIRHLQDQLGKLKIEIEPTYIDVINEIKFWMSATKHEYMEIRQKIMRDNGSQTIFNFENLVKEIENFADDQQGHLNKLLIIAYKKWQSANLLIHEVDSILKQPIRLQRMQDLDIELISKFHYVNRVPKISSINPPAFMQRILKIAGYKEYPGKGKYMIPSHKIVQIRFPFPPIRRNLEGFWVFRDPNSFFMWVFSGQNVKQLDIHGQVKRTKGVVYASDFSITRMGNVIYLNPVNNTIEFLMQALTFPEKIIFPDNLYNGSWKPVRITTGFAGCILVFQYSDVKEHGRVLKYDENGKEVFCIEMDRKSRRPLFDIPRGIMELANGNVCTIDNVRLIAVKESGDIVFEINRQKTTGLTPKIICRDNFGYIVALFYCEKEDRVINCISLLDENGNIVHELGYHPKESVSGMAVDRLNRLWIVICMDKIKIINHLNSNKLRRMKYLW